MFTRIMSGAERRKESDFFLAPAQAFSEYKNGLLVIIKNNIRSLSLEKDFNNFKKKVLNSDDKYAGCTIHKVTAEVDGGDNVLQRKILIGENREIEVLRSRVQKQEILAFCQFLEKTS